jgi:hypothetical protein
LNYPKKKKIKEQISLQTVCNDDHNDVCFPAKILQVRAPTAHPPCNMATMLPFTDAELSSVMLNAVVNLAEVNSSDTTPNK